MQNLVRDPGRRGFSLAELLVVLLVFGLAMGAATSVLVSQQRFHRDSGAIMDVRGQLRQAASILPADLRGLSTIGGDLVAMSDSAVQFRSTYGSSIACVLTLSGTHRVTLPPTTLSQGNVLTNWLSQPAVGDTMIIYDEGATTASTDDTWRRFAISAVSTVAGGCPATTGYTTAADATANSWQISVSGTIPTTVPGGAAVRFVRHARYSLYQASDGRWYLGYCSAACTGANARTAIAGPLRPYASGGASGATFTYLNASGATTATAAQVARIQIMLRAATSEAIQNMSRTFTDSLRVTVAVRNR